MISIVNTFYDGVKFEVPIALPEQAPNAATTQEELDKAKEDKTSIDHHHDYKCKDCNHSWNEQVNHIPGESMNEMPECPKCGSKDTEQTS